MSSQENFLINFFRSIFSSDDPEVIKRKKLSKIARAISKTRFSKWYKSEHLLTASCADFFFDVYRTVGPAKALLENAKSSSTFKFFAVEAVLSAGQKKLVADLSENAIASVQDKIDLGRLELEVGAKIARFEKSFDAMQIDKAYQLFKQVMAFVDLSLFDSYYFLKQFDRNLVELNFDLKPNFTSVPASLVVHQLHDFFDIVIDFPFDASWTEVFAIIERYKNVKPVNAVAWKKTSESIKSLAASSVLENIIKHAQENPDIRFASSESSPDIASEYIRNVVKTAEAVLKKIKKSHNSGKIESLLKKIFATSEPLSCTKNYTVSNKLFLNTNFLGFVYAQPLSYLKSFLIEYFKTEIRELSDLFLVRATWDNPEHVKTYSESYHELLEIVDEIIAFDESLNEGDPLAMKIKAAIARSPRDTNAKNTVVRTVNNLNASAYKMIISSCQNLVSIAKLYKLIIEDYDRPRRTLLKNWHEIELNTSQPPKKWLITAYKKIHDFVVLEQMLLPKTTQDQ